MTARDILEIVVIVVAQHLLCVFLNVVGPFMGIYGNDTDDHPTTIVFRPQTVGEIWDEITKEREQS